MFSYSFPLLSKFTIPMFWVLGVIWISASRKIYKKHLNLNALFSHTFPVLSESLFHVLGDNTADMKNNEKLLFLISFPHKPLWENHHLGVQPILFLSPTNFSISHPLVTEICKYIQYRRVGSVHGIVSIAIFLWMW